MIKRKLITTLCKECEALLLEMSKGEKVDGDALDCCFKRIYQIRYLVAPIWKKSKIYKE